MGGETSFARIYLSHNFDRARRSKNSHKPFSQLQTMLPTHSSRSGTTGGHPPQLSVSKTDPLSPNNRPKTPERQIIHTPLGAASSLRLPSPGSYTRQHARPSSPSPLTPKGILQFRSATDHGKALPQHRLLFLESTSTSIVKNQPTLAGTNQNQG